jgi:pimeloyl-ACP methyl ester carboxylesterase
MQSIFVHGLGQTPSSWNNTISLIETSVPFSCPDLHKLLNNQEITYRNLYHSFSNYCNDITQPINLCGLSLGGILALNYAMDYPEKVHSLVLISAQYKMPKTLLKLQNVIFRFMPDSAFKSMEFQKQDVIKLTSSMVHLDFTPKLKIISCPTLILCGEKDSANKKAAAILADNIPKAKFKLIKSTGHEANTESPEKLAAELNAFYHNLHTNTLRQD